MKKEYEGRRSTRGARPSGRGRRPRLHRSSVIYFYMKEARGREHTSVWPTRQLRLISRRTNHKRRVASASRGSDDERAMFTPLMFDGYTGREAPRHGALGIKKDPGRHARPGLGRGVPDRRLDGLEAARRRRCRYPRRTATCPRSVDQYAPSRRPRRCVGACAARRAPTTGSEAR